MSLILSMFACFAAVQAGALAVCVVTMILDSGPLAFLEGVGVWVFGQIAILPIALMSMPVGALLRMVLGLIFSNPRLVALNTGLLVGSIGAALVSAGTSQSLLPDYLISIAIGGCAGLVGGWVWWRIERRHLEAFAQ
ncbi:hypothetical protein [uncultured Roseobacter sp.]|uniref:hypothetical protein n=1 Tax=uncultured Roseobacter sp. TaxID=114847 RepID=UPI002608A2CA|nr:hypothetical protein [uncultured Roseobacter sp.]